MIELSDVSVSFGNLSVLDGVDLTAERGEFVALVGPNGAGKTTLLRTVNGVIDPDGGTVRLDGQPRSEMTAREVSRVVATVPQDTHVGFSFTAEQLVEMGRTPHRSRLDWSDDSDPVEAAMKRTDTLSLRERTADELSGGERQRVLLARALAQEPDALLLDEPTASLDINHRIRVLGLVEELVAEGRTAVAAIHDLDLAARFCDRLLLLHDGEIRANGPPESVLEDPTLASAYGTETAVVDNPVTGTPSIVGLKPPGDDRGTVHVVGTGSPAARVVRALSSAGFDVTLGPVPTGDVAAQTAESLGVAATTVPPFEPPPKTASATVGAAIDTADAVVIAGKPGDGLASIAGFDALQGRFPGGSTENGTAARDASAATGDFDPIVADLGGADADVARGDGGRGTVVETETDLVATVRARVDGTGPE